jgi:2-(1,2-epoxy-1,2-dihydrophenyl)acetyl-CoA isomerase
MTEVGESNLRLEREGHVVVATLDRPDKLNALSSGLSGELLDLFERVNGDDGIWALVITGAGRGFCSGVDLTGARPTERPESSHSERVDEMGWVGRQALGISGVAKPTIAAVNGVAAGAGMSLALACDLRTGDTRTRFRTVFAERSLSPDSGMSYFLPRIVGYSRAADLIFTSRDVGADEAYRLGLLDRLAEGEGALDEAIRLATTIASLPPLAIRSGKRVLQHNMTVPLEEALRYEMAGLSYARRAPNDMAEAGLSFRERRPPNFTGT